MRAIALVLALALSPGLSWSAVPAAPAAPAATEAEAPGDIVLVAIAAQRSGDFETWTWAWHPRIWQGKETETKNLLDSLREYSPTTERVLDTKIDGDKAVVTIEVSFDGNTSTGPVDLERHEGRWRITRM